MKTWNVKEKNTVRSLVCKKTRKPYRNVLLLPGKSSLDIKKMLENGSIDSNTNILAVERDPEVCKKIHKFLSSKAKKKEIKSFQIFANELHFLPLQGGEDLDFVYLDTCGQLNAKVLSWLATIVQIPGVFAPNAKIYLAFSQYYRTGTKIYDDYVQFLTEEKKSSVELNPTIVGNETENAMDQHLAMGTVLTDIFGESRNSWIYKNSGNHPAMHVFEFRPREGFKGLTSVFKFMNIYTHESPVAITPGLKAFMKRHSPKWENKAGEKPEEEARPMGLNEVLSIFHSRIHTLEVENATLKLQLIAKMSELNETLQKLEIKQPGEELKTLGDLLKETEPSKVLAEELPPPVLSSVDFPKDIPFIEQKETTGRTQRRIKEYLEAKGPTSVQEIMKDLGIGFTSAKVAVNRMAKAGKVSTQGLGKTKVVTLI